MRVTIGIPTKDRKKSLGRLLASLHGQTYKYWDLVIVNDGIGDPVDEIGKFWLESIAASGRDVRIVEGARINQAYGHNWVLWSRASNDFILRLDDDVCLQPDFLKILIQNWIRLERKGVSVGAMSGVFFTEHVRPRDQHPPISTQAHPSTSVGKTGSVTPGAYMQEYTDSGLIECEHLYSCCLYSKKAMQQVGGWPIDYSVSVSYHEETDGTYRLHLAGYKLFLVPDAKAIHSHEDTGGTRGMSKAKLAERHASDWERFQDKAVQMRGVNFRPTVALYSDFFDAPGGGSKLVRSLFDVLDEMFHDKSISELRTFDAGGTRQPDDDLRDDTFDVLVTVGHTPPPDDVLPRHKHHIHYNLFPVRGEDGIPRGVTRFVAISEFSAIAARLRFGRDCEWVYPYVSQKEIGGGIEKENVVLVVGRRSKGIIALMSVWRNLMDVWGENRGEPPRLVILTDESEQTHNFAIETPGAEIIVGASNEERDEWYRRAKVLWAGRGFDVKAGTEIATAYEHFGYTPIEALVHFCVPVAYNYGGYRETTLLRFENSKELIELTLKLLTERDFWEESLRDNLAIMDRFSSSAFANDWKRIVLSTNALAWQRECEWRGLSGKIESESDIHIAAIVEHPQLGSGFGTVARETLRGLTKDFKVHVYALNWHRPDLDGEYASLWPAPKKLNITDSLRDFLRHRRFDAAFVAHAPNVAARMLSHIRAVEKYRIPTVAHVSQEGLPPMTEWEAIMNKADKVFTYCNTAAKAIGERYGDEPPGCIYLGSDHANFRRYDDDARKALRQILNIDDRYVIYCVAANKRHKRIAGLMRMMTYLREMSGMEDALLILNTTKSDEAGQHGIEVNEYVNVLDVRGLVRLSQVKWMGAPYDGDVDETLKSAPLPHQGTAKWERELSMIDRYNMADVYVDISGAEGWGLPVFEAMGCGLPVISVDDGYVRSEILRDSPATLVQPIYSDEWLKGAQVELVDLRHVAEIVRALRYDPASPEELMAHAGKFKWDDTRDKIRRAIVEVL